MLDPNLMDGALLGRLSFRLPQDPTEAPLPPGRHALQFPEGREAVLVVPEGLEPDMSVHLLVLFHGVGGEANKVLPHFVRWARARRFLLLAPQSMFATWDIVISGHGPDLERLDTRCGRWPRISASTRATWRLRASRTAGAMHCPSD